jgi:putative ABC transport system permease protein
MNSNWPVLLRVVRLGWKSLRLHPLRSLLTVLGIIFGVCSVIAMLAIGEGASHEAQEQIKNLGSENIILRSVKPPEEQKISERSSQNQIAAYGLTQLDMRRIRSTLPDIIALVPGRKLRDYVWNISRRIDCDLIATVPDYPEARNLRLAAGRFFTTAEASAHASVCVLAGEAAHVLFPAGSSIGQDVRVGPNYYRVIGVLEPRAGGTREDADADAAATAEYRLFVPLETARMRYGEIIIKRRSGSFEAERVDFHEITIKVAGAEKVPEVADALRQLLEHGHKKKDYEIVVPLDLLRRAERTKQIFNVVLGSIAAISLLVGGIGIMNIMLASVTERTREIGIRRALGARQHDIRMQFLVETALLSAVGGLLGVLLGLGIPWFVTHFAGMKTIVTWWSPVLAFTISATTGVLFGLYPAVRAARMDPVEALRHQ